MKHTTPKTFGLLAGALALCLLPATVSAQRVSTWTGAGTPAEANDMSKQANWNGTLGNDYATTLNYNSSSSGVTAFLGSARTINTLTFSGTSARNVRLTSTLSGTSGRTLSLAAQDPLTGTAHIRAEAGTTGAFVVGHQGHGNIALFTNLQITNNGSSTINIASEVLQSAASVTAGTKFNVTASGPEVVWVSGKLRHYGDTIVQSGGTLSFNDLGSIIFRAGDSGVSNKITGEGTFTTNGEFLIDLTGASTVAGSSWTLVDASLNSTAYGNLFNLKSTLGSFTKEGTSWTINENNVIYQFSQDTGLLTVVPEASSTTLMIGFGALALAFVSYKRRQRAA